MTFLQDWKISE